MADAGTPDDVAASIVEMQELLLGTETIEEFLTELAGLAILTVGEGNPGVHPGPGQRPAVDRLRITAAEAFAILRTTSQNRNIKLRAFAAQIVQSAGALPPLPPPFDPPR
jgi:hypothetical protein